MRSPRMMRSEKSRTTGPLPKSLLMPSASITIWPDASARSACSRTAPIVARRAARSRRISSSAFTRPSLRVRLRLDALAQPHFFLGQPLVELLVMDRLGGEPLFLLPQERRVVARPRGQAAAIDLDDARRQPLQECPIVGHEHDRAGVLREKFLEPVDGVEVEMVGRLVEQQQIRLRDQRARQQHAAPPAARQRVDAGLRRQVRGATAPARSAPRSASRRAVRARAAAPRAWRAAPACSASATRCAVWW